ncbi:ATP synthase subunit b [Planctopirus ephydatiae]|uniref:ATP synthase subunit b n=1 Tax=Planctopirus ephydatiae TaxID=2528019 RepID=A0A518GKF8_9PLAN|nr:F0F1 ATP synthase subunit B [Planctopirus ephydatiae]QDV29066.1 ATP synthase subunit b [Planctopirus ephydatiae]
MTGFLVVIDIARLMTTGFREGYMLIMLARFSQTMTTVQSMDFFARPCLARQSRGSASVVNHQRQSSSVLTLLLVGMLACGLTTCFGSIASAEEKTAQEAPKAATTSVPGAADSHGTDDTHGHGAGHAAESTPPGLVPKVDLVVWSLIVFGTFVFLLSRFAWKPLAAGLDQRETRIRNDVYEAEAARIKAQQLLAEHEARLAKTEETVRELIAEAKRDADKVRADLTAAADADVQTMKKRAVAEIEQARDVALQQLFDTLSTHVMDATSRVIGRSLNNDDHQRLVQEALTELNIRRN